MPDDIVDTDVGIMVLNRCGHVGKALVLPLGIFHIIGPFQLDPDGKIVAIFAASKARFPGVPGALIKIDKLGDATVALNQAVGRHFGARDGLKIWVGICVQFSEKQIFNIGSTELTGWQTDAVNHQQGDAFEGRTFVAKRRGKPARADQSPILNFQTLRPIRSKSRE